MNNGFWIEQERTYGFKDLEARCEATKDEWTDCFHINSEVENKSNMQHSQGVGLVECWWQQ
jgi:hypothetical protein